MDIVGLEIHPADLTQRYASGSFAPERTSERTKGFEELTLMEPSGADWYFFFEQSSGSNIQILVKVKTTVNMRPGQLAPVEIAAPAITDIQESICRAFDLTMDELAMACGRTRKTLYNWRDGKPPRPSAAQRMFTLYRAARDWRQSGYPSPGPRLYEPLLGERSLYNVLCHNPINLDAIDFIGSRLAIDATSEKPLKDPFA